MIRSSSMSHRILAVFAILATLLQVQCADASGPDQPLPADGPAFDVSFDTNFEVTTTADAGPGSLRQAIVDANESAGLDRIVFDIPGTGPHTIRPLSPLPEITDPLEIDGYTQAGAKSNTNGPDLGSNAVLMIELDGSLAGAGTHGLVLAAGSSILRGLVINRFEATGVVVGGTASYVEGNHIGTDVTGSMALGNGANGIAVDGADHIIGGSRPEARNLISGNGTAPLVTPGDADRRNGIYIGGGATRVHILGNFIGVDASGARGLANTRQGIQAHGSSGNTIGGVLPAARNVISHNENGIVLQNGTGNEVQGNHIGTDVTGTIGLGNGRAVFKPGHGNGIVLHGGSGHVIGGTTAGSGNLISHNRNTGITAGFGSHSNVIQGNRIGTDVHGGDALGNGWGIHLVGAPSNLIGGANSGAGNLISGNENAGINVCESADNRILGNRIGTNADGTTAVANGWVGVSLCISHRTIIGGVSPGAGNLISGNASNGIEITGGCCAVSTGNVIEGNRIGTDVTGISSLSNFDGIAIVTNVAATRIGNGTGDGANVIAFNRNYGVLVHGAAVVENAIRGNSIHSNLSKGIGLSGPMVAPNDPGDTDTGPNGLQNYPVLTAVLTGSGAVAIEGTLNSMPSASYHIEFFANVAADPSGYGEGETFIGAGQVTTDAVGDAAFRFTYSADVPPGHFITATTTDAAGNTSEFSAALEAQPGLTPGTTPPGTEVIVEPVDPTTGTSPVEIMFDQVTAGGETTVTTTQQGPPPPSGFRLGSPPVYYDVKTTASFTGAIEICIDYTGQSFPNEKNLRLLHRLADGSWEEIPPSSHDLVDDVICGITTSLSPFLVAELNDAPVMTGMTLPPDPVVAGAPVTVDAAFADEGTADLHTADIDWGDGTITAGVVSEADGAGTVTGTHTYAEAGVYTIVVTVDDGDASGSRSSAQDIPGYIVVYDPSAGFVTGGGWIESPIGACLWSGCAADGNTIGRATFGFVSRYRKGATEPSGNTEFQFKAGGLGFSSSSYQWLVVAAHRAQFKGAGTINGGGAYGFILTAIDGALTPGGGPDMFRIRIWEAATGDLVYDNHMTSDETSSVATALGGGSIQIQK